MLTDKHKIYVHHKAKLQAGGTVSFSTTEHFQWKWEVLEQKKRAPEGDCPDVASSHFPVAETCANALSIGLKM